MIPLGRGWLHNEAFPERLLLLHPIGAIFGGIKNIAPMTNTVTGALLGPRAASL